MLERAILAVIFGFLSLPVAVAQSSTACSASVSSSVAAPSIAPGYDARLVASGLQTPRGIIFDSAGRLLVVEKQRGVTALTLSDVGGGGSCLSVSHSESVIDNSDVRRSACWD